MTVEAVRRARPDEAAGLSDLAFRSKAYWGYDAVFMERCRDDLTVTSDAIAESPYYVLEQEGRILGFYNLSETPDGVYLNNLFVAPDAIGQGVGKQLWKHMVKAAKASGCKTVFIESDPHAEAFYRSKGAERVGTVPSTIPGRTLPLLVFRPWRSEGDATD